MKSKYSSLCFAVCNQLGFLLLAIQIFASNHDLFTMLSKNLILFWTTSVVLAIIILIFSGIILELKEINKA